MGAKSMFLVLFLAVSFSCVFSKSCTPEIKEKLGNCSCNQDDNYGFFEIDCSDVYGKFADINAVLRNDFPKNTELKLKFSNFRIPFKVSSNYFEGLNITSLIFKYCNIISIADDELKPAFVGLEDTLEHLEISQSLRYPRKHVLHRNETTRFTVDHLRRVRRIEMEFNSLYHIDDMFAKGPKSLEVLNLKANKILDLGDRAFASLTNLKEIGIRHNTISNLKRSVLPNPAPYLEKIDFSFNALRELPMDMFDNMPSVKTLMFTDNELMILHERTWMTIWSHLEYLDIHDNFIKCDETIEWLFKARDIPKLFGYCNSPRKVRGKGIADLQKEKKEEAKEQES